MTKIDGFHLLSLASDEWRQTLRQIRYWVFLAIAAALAVGGYVGYALLHRALSPLSASAAMLNPRYLVGLFGVLYVYAFLLGVVFLAMDLRRRDVASGIAEVLDARPFGNLELVLGRGLGLLAACLLPLVLLALGLVALGHALGAPIEPVSLFQFVVLMALPAFVFTEGLTYLATVVLSRRLAAAVVAAAVLGLLAFAAQRVTVAWSPLVNLTGGFALGLPSDLVPWGGEAASFVQRLGVLLLGVGMMLLAAALHPRRDGRRRGATGVVAGLVVAAGLALVAVQALAWQADLHRMDQWQRVHRQAAAEPVPDLRRLDARVSIDPGRELQLEATVRLAAPSDTPLDEALLTLNPGLDVTAVEAGGKALPHRHEDGLLRVELPQPLAAGAETTLRLHARGVPDERFAYLTQARRLLELPSNRSELFLLGSRSLLFGDRYVALPDGLRWLPAAGPRVEEAGGAPRRDYYRLRLEVEVPEDLVVAAPGRRRSGEEGQEPEGRRLQVFEPTAVVPAVTLLAAPFERRTAEVEGVQLEVLVHPDHVAALDRFAAASEEITGWIGARLAEARRLGLPYPYEALRLVEVPNNLRGYGGGWRMGSTLGPPGLVLMRESGFPTARFGPALEELARSRSGEELAVAQRRMLARFFANDFHGGNVFSNVAADFFLHQTAAAGEGAVALNQLFDQLVQRLVSGDSGYFSAHVFTGQLSDALMTSLATWATLPRGEDDWSRVVARALTARDEVWKAARATPLAQLEPAPRPRLALDLVTLKGRLMARTLVDALGPDRAARLLADLRREHLGETVTAREVLATAEAVGGGAAELLRQWLHDVRLPGFLVQEVDVYRLPDAPGPRYQTRIQVANPEPVSGVFRLRYRVEDDGAPRATDTVRVPAQAAVEVGFVTESPPRDVELDPYLALNRLAFRVPLPAPDVERVVEAEARTGVRPVAVAVASDGAVVVDDLDPGFATRGGDAGGGLRLGRGAAKRQDGELPPFQLGPPPARWSRLVLPESWGRYRHTVALVRAGSGDPSASFTTRLPRSGRWRLEVHLPADDAMPFPGRRGTWRFSIEADPGRRSTTLAASEAADGWVTVETLDLPAGEVTVRLESSDEGGYLAADAVRWVPSGGGGSAP